MWAHQVELEYVKYPDYLLSKMGSIADYNSISRGRGLHVYIDTQGRHACQMLKEVIPRWRFLTSLDGDEYYQQLLLNITITRKKDLLSDSNVSKTYKEECYLRNLIKQMEDALCSLEDAAERN